jgi:hypothetical protein
VLYELVIFKPAVSCSRPAGAAYGILSPLEHFVVGGKVVPADETDQVWRRLPAAVACILPLKLLPAFTIHANVSICPAAFEFVFGWLPAVVAGGK